MKKIHFKIASESLTRREMRSIMGGSGFSSDCGTNSSCSAGCQIWRNGDYYCSTCCLA